MNVESGEPESLPQRLPAVITPLGTVALGGSLGPIALSGLPVEAGRLSRRSTATLAQGNAATLKIISGEVNAVIPQNVEPVTLWAAVWWIQAHSVVPGLELSLRLRDFPADVSGGADPGESLEAVTVENSGSVLTLGGPDLEAIRDRAEAGQDFPRRWAHELQNQDNAAYAVEVGHPATLTWRLPGLRPNETVRFCTAAAWGAPGSDPATWYAVDVTADSVLKQLFSDRSES